MKIRLLPVLVLSVLVHLVLIDRVMAQPYDLNAFNIKWDSQSKNSGESMPCGGGDIGLNVWVENGDLLVYIDRSGNIDENDQQLKTGRVRIRINPNPFSELHNFRQELKLKDGCVEIESVGSDPKATIKVWVEVHHPVIHFEVNANQAINVQSWYENWRNKKRSIPRTLLPTGDKQSWDYNRFSLFGYFGYEGEVITYPDTVKFINKNSVLFFHRNTEDLIFDKEIKLMRLGNVRDELIHPTKNRIFGGIMSGDGFIAGKVSKGVYLNTPYKAWELYSKKPLRSHHIKMMLHTSQTPSEILWRKRLDKECKEIKRNENKAWNENLAWWEEFWNRSFVVINPGTNDDKNIPWQLGRNFQLFRYQLACNAYGEWPTRFNGGLFTFDPVLVDKQKANPDFYNPDFRYWGAWTSQNQRLVHWPMLKNGDFDVILPQFEFYRKNMPNVTARTKEAWDIEGCSFCEQIGSGGLPLGSHYGWEPPYGTRDTLKEVGLSDIHATYYTTQLEFAFMIHEWYRFTGGDIYKYLPFMKGSVIFHMNYFSMLQKRRTGEPYDENGFLVLSPSHALETYHGKNSTDVLSALRTNLECLINLPEKWVNKQEKQKFNEWLKRIPPINFRLRSGMKTISPVEGDPKIILNYEVPQLYPVFPWPIYGIGKPDLEVAIDTWRYGLDVWTRGRKAEDPPFYPQRDYWYGWTQQAIWLARLGLTVEAKDYVTKKMSNARGNKDYNSPLRMRFPSFWGPGFDWTPDHNWGGSGMIAIQEMLMQTPDSSIYVFPAWPKDWDVHFKLHAPYNTTVEVILDDGKINLLKVLPESRSKNVKVIMND